MSFQHRHPHPIHGDRSLQQRTLADDFPSYGITDEGIVTGVGLVAAIAVDFVLLPMAIGYFKPEWSYGKRLAATILGNFALGAVTGVVKAASGTDETK